MEVGLVLGHAIPCPKALQVATFNGESLTLFQRGHDASRTAGQ